MKPDRTISSTIPTMWALKKDKPWTFWYTVLKLTINLIIATRKESQRARLVMFYEPVFRMISFMFEIWRSLCCVTHRTSRRASTEVTSFVFQSPRTYRCWCLTPNRTTDAASSGTWKIANGALLLTSIWFIAAGVVTERVLFARLSLYAQKECARERTWALLMSCSEILGQDNRPWEAILVNNNGDSKVLCPHSQASILGGIIIGRSFHSSDFYFHIRRCRHIFTGRRD